jgi:hypothetical protein
VIAWLAAGLFESTRVAHETALIEGWHEFYLLAGTAAVTLVGLLFVSLSFHLEALLHESRAALLAHARETLLSFMYVLVLSLEFLVPEESPRPLGAAIALLSGILLLLAAFSAARERRRADPAGHLSFLDRRRRTLMVAYAAGLVIGVVMIVRHDAYMSYWMIGVVCTLLGNAAGSAWDLLVQVGRIKQAQERATRG